MEAVIAEKEAVWVGRGQRRRQIPPKLLTMFEQARDGKVLVVDYDHTDDDERQAAEETIRLFRSYAYRLHRWARVQTDPGQLRLQLGDAR